jgi:O-antigen ligase
VLAGERMATARRALLAAFVLGLGFSITLAQTALALLTLLWLAKLCDRTARDAVRWPLWRPVLAFGAVSVVSALFAPHPGEGLVACKKLLLVAALYVSVEELDSAERAERLLSALALAVAGAAAVGLLQVSLCPGPEADYGLPAWLYHRCARTRGFFSAGLAATYTRGAWIGFAAGVLALWLPIRKRRWLLVVGLVTLGLAVLAGPQHLRERVITIADPDDVTVKERIYMWRSGIAMWREHPGLGVGPGGVKREYRHYAQAEALKQRTGHLHNSALQILVELGVAGLLAWLWLWAAFFTEAVRLLRRLPAAATRERTLVAGSIAAITGFLVAGTAEYTFGDSEVVMLAWVIVALPYVVARGRPFALVKGVP